MVRICIQELLFQVFDSRSLEAIVRNRTSGTRFLQGYAGRIGA